MRKSSGQVIAFLFPVTVLALCGCNTITNTPELSEETENVQTVLETEQIPIVEDINDQIESINDQIDDVNEQIENTMDELANIDTTPISGEWSSYKYGHLSVYMTFNEHGGREATYIEYTAPSENLANLRYVCTAMNAFVELNNFDGEISESDVYLSALPGEDNASLFLSGGTIGGNELDGTYVFSIPAWFEEYNEIDSGLLQWILNCYGECIDELRVRTEKLGKIIGIE